MSIVIRVVGGRRDGRSYNFDHAKTAITVGRFDDRDIRFSSKETQISRAHLTIVQVNHRYFLQPEGACFLNGQPVMKDDPLPPSCEVALGAPSGVKLKIAWSPPGDMATTEPVFARPVAPAGVLREAVKAQAMARRASRRSLAIGLAALVLAIGGAAAILMGTREEPIEAALARARPSVYLVLARDAAGTEAPRGTAWVIAPGTLATNAHVVEPVLEDMKKGLKVFVRSGVAPHDSVEVTAAVKHPHYEALQRALDRFLPVDDRGARSGFSLGYDVGLLRVAPNAKLAPPLKVAAMATLEKLDAGQPAAIVGYPTEELLAGGFNIRSPSAHTHVARLTSVTDYFLVAGDPRHRHLLHHALPSAGGASGSPIFDARGEVIGLHNAANMLFISDYRDRIVRVPSASLINFGQRADLVVELLENRAEAATAARTAYWTQQLTQFSTGPDFMGRVFLAKHGIRENKPTSEKSYRLERQGNAAQVDIPLSFPAAGETLLLASNAESIDIYFEVFQGQKSIFKHKTKGPMVHVEINLHDAVELTVRITGDAPTEASFRVYYVRKAR
jgi:V8-like Glu-specific endopeptidase